MPTVYDEVKQLINKGSNYKAIEEVLKSKNVGYFQAQKIKIKLFFDSEVSPAYGQMFASYTPIFAFLNILLVALSIGGILYLLETRTNQFLYWSPYIISILSFGLVYGVIFRLFYEKITTGMPQVQKPSMAFDFGLGLLYGTIFLSDTSFLVMAKSLAGELIFFSVVFSILGYYLSYLHYRLTPTKAILLTLFTFALLTPMGFLVINFETWLAEYVEGLIF